MEDKKQATMSRRTFVGALTGLAGAGLAAAALGSTGCATQTGDAGKTASAADSNGATSNEYAYDTYDTDVVVVGGGIAGIFAAQKAMEGNARVIVLDKGPFGHSGASGINWGHTFISSENTNDDGAKTLSTVVKMNEGMIDQAYMLEVSKCVHEAQPIQKSNQTGGVAYRGFDGKPAAFDPEGVVAFQDGCFTRTFAQDLRRTGVEILERTMALDVALSPEGKAAGVVALDLSEGKGVVVRAKAVVMATGSFVWSFGWAGNGACTIGSPESTGAGHAIFLRHGAEMKYMEQMAPSFYATYPTGTAYGMGVVGFGGAGWKLARNKDNEYFTKPLEESGVIGGNFARLIFKEIYDGKGTADGAIFVDTTQPELWNRYSRRSWENEERFLGYEVPALTECMPQFWECAGRPVLSTTGESAIPGLYYAGCGETSWRGISSFGSVGTGTLAGKNAALTAAKSDTPKIAWADVEKVFNKTYDLLENEPDNPKRALEVMHILQQATYDGLYPIRSAETLNTFIAELERIRDEEFPHMNVTSKSRRFNSEWRHAIEVQEMWDCVMASAQAALAREETRGAHIRLDFPDIDNENWLKDVIVKKEGDTWSVETREIETPVISADQIKELLAADISFFA